MKNRKTVLSVSTLSCYLKLFWSKRAARLATIVILSCAAASIITALSFAKDPHKTPRAGSRTEQPVRTDVPRLSASARDISNSVRDSRASIQDQDRDQRGTDKVEKGWGNAPAKEWRLRKARPFTGDLRQLPQTRPAKVERAEREKPDFNPQTIASGGETQQSGKTQASAVASLEDANVSAPASAPTANFEGLDFNNWGNSHPADANGDVGPTYYIQAINSSVGIFNKSNGNRVAAFTFNTFMSQGQFGNLCDTSNLGNAVVLYDTFEDRWVITDFAYEVSGGSVLNPPGAYQCFAVSRSGDPVSGGWNYYSLHLTDFLGDYPKLGVWPDGIYMSANLFGFPAGSAYAGPRVWALNKAQMYAGANSIQVVSFDGPAADFTLLPSNARLQTGTPPAGTPNYFLSTTRFMNAVTVYKFRVDWDHISASTFTGPDVPLASSSWPSAAAPAAPSLGGNDLDSLSPRAMMQNQYTNIGGVESLWAVHTVRRQDNNGFSAPRFYQVPVTGGTVGPNITQAATFDPDGANLMHRFMPSVAVDRAGNMAVGYSTSSASTKPAIKYAGRLATDPLNTFSQTEQVLIQGDGTQVGDCGVSPCTRWGQYSAMTVDPDGCTFWYTNMYYAEDGLNYHTRIGSFTLPQCTTAGQGSIQGVVTSSSGGGAINGATVRLGSRTATTDAGGFYSFTGLPAGTYPVMMATFPGYTSGVASNLVVNESSLTTQNFVLSPAPNAGCLTDSSQADFQRGVPTSVDLTSSPGNVTLTSTVGVDQQNTTLGNGGLQVSTTQWIGQTFVPSVSGPLAKLDINLFCNTCTGTNPPVTVEVRATNGTLPTSTVLASATVPGFSSGTPTFYTVTFSTPPVLTAGTRYAIMNRLTTARAAGTGNYMATISTANPFPGGILAFSSNGGTTFSSIANDDLGFRTYMQMGYVASGNLVSGVFDANPHAGGAVNWTSLSWNTTTPAGTSVKFQVAASNNPSGPFNFVGPDGMNGTFFTTSGASLSQFNGQRYLKYQAFLATTNSAATPSLQDVTLCFSNTVPTTLNINSASGTFGGTVNLSATLTDGASPLSGRTVNFTLNGNSVGSGVTDASGVASLLNASLAGINANTYPTGVGASFAGDATLVASSGANTLTVNKADAGVNVSSYNVPYDGNSHTATGTATGVNGENLAGLDLSGTTHTNAGNYAGDAWTFTDVTGNYNNTNGTVDDVISTVGSGTVVTVGDATYDGGAHGGTAEVTGVGGLNQSLTVSYAGRNTTVYGPSTVAPSNAGEYTASASFPGDGNHQGSSDSKNFTIFQAGSLTIVSCPATVPFTGSPVTPCTARATGVGGLNTSVGVSYLNNSAPGTATANASYAGDPNHTPSSGSANFTIEASSGPPPLYNFVIGDNNASVGNQVTFWGAEWASLNSLTGGAAPASFKGFASATSPQPASCGGTWTGGGGSSSAPPATLPELITVMVSSSVTKNGSVISGDVRKLVVVRTNAGYAPDPSHPGTGTVVSVVCQ